MEDFVPLSKSENKKVYRVYLDNKPHPGKKQVQEFPSQRLNVIRAKCKYPDQQLFWNLQQEAEILMEEEERVKIKEIESNSEIHMKTIVEEPPSFYIKIMNSELRAECNVPKEKSLREARKYIERRSLVTGSFHFIDLGERQDYNLEPDSEIDGCLENNQDLLIELETSAQFNQFAFKTNLQPLANPQQACNEEEEEKQFESVKTLMPQDLMDYKQSQTPVHQIHPEEVMVYSPVEQQKEMKEELKEEMWEMQEMEMKQAVEDEEKPEQQTNPEPSQEEYNENVTVIRSYVEDMPEDYYLKTLYLLKAECMEAIFIDQNINIERYYESVNKQFQKLKQQVEEFEIDWDDGQLRAMEKIKEMGQMLQSHQDFNARAFLKVVEERISKACPINFDQILYYEGKAKQAREKVRGQDVLLLCGESGVGKSTTLHYLQGNKMVKAKENGMICIKAVNSKATNIIARASTSSVTKYVDGVMIYPKDMSPLLNDYESIFLADSAGFFDTSGAEHDIVNCIGLVEAMKVANSVRIVLILHLKAEGTRFQGAHKAAKMLNLLIDNVKDNLRSISYVFNGYSKETIKNVNPQIADLLKKDDQSIQNDIGFKDLLTDMYKKTRGDHILMLDLLDETYDEFLEKLLQTEPMKHPEEKFQFALGSETSQRLEKGLKRIQRDILTAFKCQKYDVAEYLYTKYNYIEKVLQFENVTKSSRDEIIRQISSQITQTYNEGEIAIKKCFQTNYPLEQSHIDTFEQTVYRMKQYDGFREKINKELPSSYSFEQILDGLVNENTSRLQNPKSLASSETRIFIGKLETIANKYLKFKNLLKYCQGKIMEAGQSLHNEFQESINTKEFQKSVEIVRQVKQLLDAYGNTLNQEVKNLLSCERYQGILMDHLKKMLKAAQKVVDDPQVEINNANEFFQTINQVKIAIRGFDLLKYEEVNSLETEMVSYICAKVKTEAEKIFTLKQDNQLSSVRESVENIQRLRKIEGIKMVTEELYQDSVRQLMDYAIQKQEMVAKVIDEGESNLQNINYEQLLEGIRVLESLAWMDQIREGFSQGQFEKICDKLRNNLDKVMKDLQKVNFSIDDESSVSSFSEVLYQMEGFKGVEKTFKQLDETVQPIKNEIKRQVEGVANECLAVFQKIDKENEQIIQKQFENINLEQASQVMKFLLRASKYIQPSLLEKLEIGIDKNLFLQHIYKTLQVAIQDMCTQIEKEFKICKTQLLLGLKEDQKLNEIEEEKTLQKDSSKSEKISTYIDKLYIYMKRLKTMEEKSFSIKDYFDKFDINFDVFQEELSKFLDNIFRQLREMLQEKQNIQFLETLSILKSLIELDEFFEPKKIGNKYNEFKSEFSEQLPQDFAELSQQITNHQFDLVQLKIQEFDGNDPKLAKYRFQLNIAFKTSIEGLFLKMKKYLHECDSSYSNTEVENYRQIQNLLEILDKALEIKEPLLKEEENELFKNQQISFLEKVKTQLGQNFRQLESHIDLGKFFESNQQIKKFKIIMQIFQTSTFHKDLEEQLAAAEKRKKEYIDKIVEKYSNMDIYSIKYQRPKELFQRLSQDEFEKDNIIKIQKVIKDQFDKEAQRIIADKTLSDYKKKRKLESLGKLTGMLGDKDDEDLQEMLTQYLEDMDKAQKEQEEHLIHLQNTENFQELQKQYEELRKSKRQPTCLTDILTFFNKSLTKVQLEIKTSVETQSSSLSSQITQFFQILDHHPDPVVKNQKFVKDVKAQVGKLFSKHQSQLQEDFDAIQKFKGYVSSQTHEAENMQQEEEEVKNSQISGMFEQNQNFIDPEASSLVFILDALKDGGSLQQCIEEGQLNQINQLIKRIVKYFANEQILFQQLMEKYNTLQENDITQLCKLLNQFSNADCFIKQLKDRIEILQAKQLIMPQEKLFLEKIAKSDDMKIIVLEQFTLLQETTVQELYTDEFAKNQANREFFFNELNTKLLILNNLPTLRAFLPKKFYQKSKVIFEQIKEKATKLANYVSEILNERNSSLENKIAFQNYYKVLLSYNKCITVNLTIIKVEQQLGDIKQIVNKFIIQKEENITKTGSKTPDSIKSDLIELKEMAQNFEPFREQINSRIDHILNNLKTNKDGAALLSKVGKLLDGHNIGGIILQEHAAFNGINISILNQKFKKRTISAILNELKADNACHVQLLNRYNEIMKIYEKEVTDNIKGRQALPGDAIGNLVTKIKRQASKCSNNDVKYWGTAVQDQIPTLIGLIFALWTMINSIYYFESLNSSEDNQSQQNDSFLLQPHAGQVVSILRILCIADKDDGQKQSIMKILKKFVSSSESKLQSNLVQIGTGEGKSVTLAVTASILALLGFEVSSVCYSEYLCTRDFNEFTSLFQVLGIDKKIEYQTFNQLCEKKINENGDIRKLTREIILKGGIPEEQKQNILKKNSILLIDEVDVFFKKDFFGNIYQPQTIIQDPTISNFLDYLWENFSNLKFKDLKNCETYKLLSARFKQFQEIIDEQVKLIFFDLKNFKQHEYIVSEGKIGYKDQDKIEFNINYGFKTLFAYYLEHQNGKISKDVLDNQKGLRINCGAFAYATIPDLFQKIMGVTGTLQSLSDFEKSTLLEKYKIGRYTFIPSAFSATQRICDAIEDFSVEKESDYFNKIAQKIDHRLSPNSGSELAVLVFFETSQQLYEFYNSESFAKLKQRSFTLTEQDSENDKKLRINQAATSGTITLFTTSFGRGTNFICKDKEVNSNGGAQVIITFMPHEPSEQEQLMGRTGRQGESGRVIFIIKEQSLEKILGPDFENLIIQNKSRQKAFIEEERNKMFIREQQENSKFVADADKLHKDSLNFVQALCQNNIGTVSKFLLKQNIGPQLDINAKECSVIICMDATGSMSGLIKKTKETIHQMFQRSKQILENNQVKGDCILIQLACYRNYNAKEDMLLQVSPYENQPKNLETFMSKINADFGWGQEAIEVALAHCYQQSQKKEIQLVLVIGDAGPNSQEEVTSKRKRHGENYWRTTQNYAEPKYYEYEIGNLNSKNIPIYSFYVAQNAKSGFEKMAQLSKNGKCGYLDVNSDLGSEYLVNTVTTSILEKIQEQNDMDVDLVSQYKQSFPKGYAA